MASLYDFTVQDIDGAPRALEAFRGKVLLIVILICVHLYSALRKRCVSSQVV